MKNITLSAETYAQVTSLPERCEWSIEEVLPLYYALLDADSLLHEFELADLRKLDRLDRL